MKLSAANISSYISIRENRVNLNSKPVFETSKEVPLKQFLKQAYTFLKMDYPKFHKMDRLCKLGMLGAEIINLNHNLKPSTGLVFANSASSLDTDRQHQKAINNGFASPATFVYTLPNIVLGELSIKYNLQSENVFFVTSEFNAETLYAYTESLIEEQCADQYLLGWIDVDKVFYNAFLCLISPRGKFQFNITNLNKAFEDLL